MRRGRYGVPMQVYGSILPSAATLARLLPQLAAEGRAEVTLSRGAQCRLKVIRWHETHGRNVTRTADHFGYSRPTIYAWLKGYTGAGPIPKTQNNKPRARGPPPRRAKGPAPPATALCHPQAEGLPGKRAWRP